MRESLESLKARTPAKRMVEIPDAVLDALSDGLIPTKTLTEWLAVDRPRLLEQVGKQMGFLKAVQACDIWTVELMRQSALKHSMAIGRFLTQVCQVGDDLWKKLASHESDIVREWSALVIGLDPELTFARKLAWVKPIADDDHPGLRETAWLALRPDVASNVEKAIRALEPWTGSRRERLRRYASEITRPRGVWTHHIALLKEHPELGLPLLEPLCSDDSKYVRDSVANWMNDASKSQPEWVRAITDQWIKRSPTKNTAAIVKRALRTIGQLPGSKAIQP